MTWLGLAHAFAVLVAAFALFFQRHWPRNPDGTLMDPMEVERRMQALALHRPNPDTQRRMQRAGIVLFVTIAALAVALSPHAK